MAETAILERSAVVRHGRKLEYFTIGWNALEGLVAVVAGKGPAVFRWSVLESTVSSK